MGLQSASMWLVLVLILSGTWYLLDLPKDAELILILSDWLARYGLPLLFISSLLESVLFVGFYFPGSLIIFLGVGLAASIPDAMVAVAMVSLGMIGGYGIDYLLGRYGWYRFFLRLGMRQGLARAEVKMQQNDARYVFYTFWNPGLAAFTATAAGVLRVPVRRFAFLGLLAILVWNTFWGVLVYMLGATALSLVNFKVVISVIGLWISFELTMVFWRRRATDKDS
jgi:membrane protein DedA with SNARE-associated domain